MSEYEITRSLAPWKRTQSTSYLVESAVNVLKKKIVVIKSDTILKSKLSRLLGFK